jgi:mono/diheme cytochrome c family protein
MIWLRRVGILFGVLLTVIVLGAASVYAMSESRLTRKYTLPTEALVATGGAESIARGAHVATAIAKCTECHASDLGGGVVIDAPAVGHVEATNLTTGRGGVLASYDDAKLERAIRHGIGADGRNLLIMPSSEYHHLSDSDVAAVIAYIRSRPAVDREHAPSTLGPVLRVMWAAGKAFPANAELIAHDAPHLKLTPVGSNEEAGRYIAANGCSGCHGETYSGGPIPGAPPEWKPAANITPAGIGAYTLADFRTMLREGKRPSGTVVDTLMPIRATKLMTDEEIEAVYKFLKTVPAKPYGGR